MAPALRAGGGELRGGWGRALHLPALPRVAVEGAAHDERARAHQRRVPPPHQDAGAVAHRGRRPFAPLRPPAQRAHHAPTTRRLARDPELGPNRQQGSVASSEENNDSSTVPDDALRSFPPLDRHRRCPVPWCVCALGYFLLLLGMGITAWAQAVNKFFEPSVRIQTERGHGVID